MPNVQTTPQVESIQFGGGSNDDKHINLFRGDVNFTIPLFHFAGRNDLSVSMGASYSSSIAPSVNKSNLIAPTGILGLGWELALNRIDAETVGSADVNTMRYYYTHNNIQNRLYRTSRKWQRATLKSSFSTDLDQQNFSSDLWNTFLDQGLWIDETASIQVITNAQAWRITDPVNEFELEIQAKPTELIVYDGGDSYELQSFDFSQIRYYRKFERWVITYTNGLTSSFGGNVSTDANGYKQSQGNSIVWGVCWGNWIGPSTLTHDNNGNRIQQQYPLSWHITTMTSAWQDHILYAYQQEQQSVGTDGLPYTKAIYIAHVTDMFGNTANFNYKNKQFNTSASQAREYLDPNKTVANNTPDAFQSRYETLYLDTVVINNPQGELDHTMMLEYELENFATIPSSAPPTFVGDTTKRVLTKITRVMPDDYRFPDLEFSYNSSANANPGAMHTRLDTAGALTTYSYHQKTFANLSRSITIPISAGAQPRVWFGNDYSVVMSIDSSNQFQLNVYMWSGRWIHWQPTSFQTNNINPDDINFIGETDYFVLDCGSGSNQSSFIYAFHKDNHIIGNWLVDSASPIILSTTQRQTVGGDKFFIVNNRHDNSISSYTWDNLSHQWQQDTVQVPCSNDTPNNFTIFAGATDNILVTFCYDRSSAPGSKQNVFQLRYLDALNTWHLADTLNDKQINIDGSPETNFQWTASSWVFAATYITQDGQISDDYDISLLMWEENEANSYTLLPLHVVHCTVEKTNQGNLIYNYQAQISATGLLLSGSKLLRYNGNTWLENDNLNIKNPIQNDTIIWFAQDNDIVLKTENNQNTVLGVAQVFDPNTESSAWQSNEIVLYNSAPTQTRLSRYYPTAGSNFVTFDDNIYAFNKDLTWVSALQSPTSQFPSQINTTTVINQSPNFMVYLNTSNQTAIETEVLILGDNFTRNTETLNENFYQFINNGKADTNPNGKFPATNAIFVTYLPLNATFTQASSLILHHYLNDSIQEPLQNFPVSKVTVDDGFDIKTITYQFDDNNAAINPSGTTARYFETQTFEGGNKNNGWTEYHFFNGYDTQPSGANPSTESAFDGLLKSINMFDATGTLIGNQSNEWQVHTEIIPIGTSQTQAIQGAYIGLSATTHILDDVSYKQNYTIDLSSGQVQKTHTEVYNASGTLEIHNRKVVFGYQAYPALVYQNHLEKPIDVTSSVGPSENVQTVNKRAVSLWDYFPARPASDGHNLKVFAIKQSYQMQQPVNKPLDYNNPADFSPDDWLLTSDITERNSQGLTVLNFNPGQVPTSIQYDALSGVPVALFNYASISDQEAFYYGFEPYEAKPNWALTDKTPITNSISHTGTQCLEIPSQQTGAQIKLTPKKQDSLYLFSFWAKTDTDFVANDTTGWRLSFSAAFKDIIIPVTKTDEWVYYSHVIDLSTAKSAVILSFSPTNSSNASFFVDNVVFANFTGQANVTVYNPVDFRVTAKLGPYDQVSRTTHDYLRRMISNTTNRDNLSSTTVPFLSRQIDNTFNAATPNHQIALQPMGQVFYDRFMNNGVWQDNWQSNTPTNWVSEKGLLKHTNTVAGQIVLKNPNITRNYYAYLEPVATQPITTNIGLNIGTNASLTWSPTNKNWTLKDTVNNQTKTVDAVLGNAWLVVITNDALAFFVNGQIIFDMMTPDIITGNLEIFTSDLVAFTHVQIGENPQFAMRYFDGAGRTRQGQSIEGDNIIVAQTVYDTLLRPVINVKPVSYDATQTGYLAYRDDVVVNFDWETGLMNGRANDAYPDDNGYPYQRQLLENSPLARKIEVGLPGKDFAITNLSTTQPSQRHTVKFEYSKNTATNVPSQLNLPEGHYAVKTTTDSDGNQEVTISDTLQKMIAHAKLDTVSNTYLTTLYLTTYTDTGTTNTTRLPNFYAPPQPSETTWERVQNHNLLGQKTTQTTPNAGMSHWIYNVEGSLRFSQDAAAAEKGLVYYYKYDDYNRQIEAGYFSFDEDFTSLSTKADDTTYPSTSDGAIIIKTAMYDGEQVNQYGYLTELNEFTDTTTPSTKISSQQYVFGNNGEVAQYIQTIAALNESYTTKFTYNNQNLITKITYNTDREVVHILDSAGRVSQIQDGVSGQVFASYQYRADNKLISETFNPGVNEITNTYTYNSPGWITKIENDLYRETLSYQTGGANNNGYFNGLIANIESHFKHKPINNNNFPETITYSFAYDSINRLTVAKATAAQFELEWSLGNNQPISYDANGNFIQVEDGNTTDTYQYQPGTDKVINTQGNDVQDYEYNANGAVIKALPNDILNIEYDTLNRHVNAIETQQNGLIKFEYDGLSKRILKQTDTSSLRYIRSPKGSPLVEIETPNNSASQTTEYVYGPSGLIGLFSDKLIYPVFKDHLQSIRGVVDKNKDLITAIQYRPFGDTIAQSTSADVPLRYRFTGFEYDPETGLYNATARFYDPKLRRFLSTDPKLQFASPYIYGNNNPINMTDPSGEVSLWVAIVGDILGAIVGIAATVATGGALAFAFGMEEGAAIGATTAVAATAGAVGSISGDATSALIKGEPFTAKRALVDIVSGAVGGAVGEVVGGSAASKLMRSAFVSGSDAATVGRIGTRNALIIGGISGGIGALAASTTSATMTGQPLFSANTFINVVTGIAGGAGGAWMASGAYMRIVPGGDDLMPIPLTRDDFALIQMRRNDATDGSGHILLTSVNESQYNSTMRTILAQNANNQNAIFNHTGGTADVIALHGVGRFVIVRTGATQGRPMSAGLFAEYLATRHPDLLSTAARPSAATPVKLSICFAALPGPFGSVGQSISSALGRTTLAGRGTVYPHDLTRNWVHFNP